MTPTERPNTEVAPGTQNTMPRLSGLRAWLLSATSDRAPALGRLMLAAQAPWEWATSRSVRARATAIARRLNPQLTDNPAACALAQSIVRNCYAVVYDAGRGCRRDWRDGLSEIDQVIGRERFLRARTANRGVIVATTHIGPFEPLAAALRQYEPRVHVVFQAGNSHAWERVRSRSFARLGLIEAPVSEGYDVWLTLRKALERDEVVLLHGDTLLHGQRGVRVPFVGGHIMAPSAPIKLALLSGAPIVPMFAVRTSPLTARVYFEPSIPIEPGPAEEGGVHPGVSALCAVLGKYAKLHADQWRSLAPLWLEDQGAPVRA